MTGTLDSLTYFRLADQNRPRQLAALEKDPEYKRTVERFRAQAAKIETVDDLLKDRNALTVALGAVGLEDQIDAKALIKKVLTEDPNDRKSFVNRTLEPRYKELANLLGDLGKGKKPFAQPGFVDKLIERFRTTTYEKVQGFNGPGVREALYFKRVIGGVQNLNQILADKTLKEVVRVASGIPSSVGSLDFDQQKTRFAAKIDVAKFKDPRFVDRFINRYLVQTQIQSGQLGPSPLVGLFQPAGGVRGGAFSLNLLA